MRKTLGGKNEAEEVSGRCLLYNAKGRPEAATKLLRADHDPSQHKYGKKCAVNMDVARC